MTLKNLSFTLLVLSAVLFCVPLTAVADEVSSPKLSTHQILSQELSRELDDIYQKEGFDGTIIVRSKEKTLLARSYGYANRSEKIKNTSNTLSDIGSIAKTFTAAAILILIEDGKLSLNDTVGNIFPHAPSDKKLLTIENLLSHGSGLDNFHNKTDFDEMTKDEAVKKILNLRMIGKPNEKIAYSNAAYTLLAAIVEKITGSNFQKYVRRRVLKPLNLNDTGFYGEPRFDTSHLAKGYGGSDSGKTTFEKGLTWALIGQGGMVSSADDLATWFDAIISGRIFSNSKNNMMLNKANTKWMLGNIRHFSSWGTTSYYAGGSTDFGYTASVQYLPDLDVFVVAIFNSYLDRYGNATHHRIAKNHIFPILIANPPSRAVEIEVLDSSALNVIGKDTKLEILATDLGWAEGPTWAEPLNSLLFSDIEANTVYQWNDNTGLSTYLHPSGHNPDGVNGAWRGSNGLLIDDEDRLLLAQQGGRTLAQMNAPLSSPKSDFTILAERFDGKRLNSPNDLIMHNQGILYFTDPPYGLDGFENSPAVELPFFGVFAYYPDKSLRIFDQGLKKPNGVALSTDQSSLYVSDSDPEEQKIWRYGLDTSGNRTNKSLFFDAMQHTEGEPGGTDGLATHKSGLVFSAIPGGVGVISETGELLAVVRTGFTTNLAFNDEQSALYILTPHTLMRMALK